MSRKKLSEISIEGLTQNDDYWRIDWLGDLSYPDRIRRHSQPSIEILLSKLKGRPQDVDLNHRECSDCRNQRVVILPIGLLPILRVGDIWRRDRYVVSPAYITKFFSNIQIDDEHCYPIIAGGCESNANQSSKQFFLSTAYHPYHSKHTRSKCVVISIPDQKNKIVIPQLELARFYFGSSVALISKLFSYGMAMDEIYNSEESEALRSDGSSFIQLRTKMKDVSVADIARIAFDKHAKKAAALISNSIAKCAKDQHPIYAETNFPFSGNTSLAMTGKWLPFGDDSKVFICYRIIRCTAPFPFESLDFFRDNAGNKDGTHDPSRPLAFEGGSSSQIPGSDNEDANEVTDEEPFSFLDDTEIVIPGELPFPDLTIKQIEKKRQKPCEFQSSDKPNVVTNTVEGIGIGEGGTNPKIGSAEVTRDNVESNKEIATAEKLPVHFHTFFRILSALRRRKGIESISFEQPIPGANDPRCSVFPLVKTETGRNSTWPFIDYVKGICNEMRLRRRVVIARIVFETKVSYLLEIERRVDVNGDYLDVCSMLLLYRHGNTEISKTDLQAVLTECAMRRGGWLSDEGMHHLHRHSLKHISLHDKQENDAIGTFVNKIIAKL